MALKDNLKRIRQLKGIKVAQIVKETGVSKESYYAYERGKYKPSEETLNKIASLFGVEVKEFYVKNGTYVEVPTNKESPYIPGERETFIENTARMGRIIDHLLKEIEDLRRGASGSAKSS